MDSELREPKLLALGKIFEAQFRKQFLGTGGSSDNVEVAPHCRVVRSRGTERSQMLDSFGEPTSDAERSLSLQTVRPIVIRGFGSVDLMVFYVDDEGAQCHVVVEIKNTDWNAIPRGRVVRTLGAQRRQVYGYLEPLEYRARRNEIGKPQAILVYPSRPESADKDESILNYLSDYGIQFEYTDELLQGAVADNQPLKDVGMRHQGWLAETPACDMCSAGQVSIRQVPSPRRLTEDLAQLHAALCPASGWIR